MTNEIINDVLTFEEIDELELLAYEMLRRQDGGFGPIDEAKAETIMKACYKILVNAAIIHARPNTIMRTGDIVRAGGNTYDVLILSWGDADIRRATSPWKVAIRDKQDN